jgi:MFS family permease
MGDNARLMAAQGFRAFAYGFTAILLGRILASQQYSSIKTGFILTAIILGTSLSSFFVRWLVHTIGARKSYTLFYSIMMISGLLIAIFNSTLMIALVGLAGVLSTDANDNGAATILEQVMFAENTKNRKLGRLLGRYNALSATAGSLGALTVGWFAAKVSSSYLHQGFLLFSLCGLGGLVLSLGLSTGVEKEVGSQHRALRESPSRRKILQLAALFALDSAAGGLTTATWLSYYLTQRYHLSAAGLGYLFALFAILQSISMVLAPIVAESVGLVATMVISHLMSNLFLIIAAFCGDVQLAILFLLLRASLSQMDIPTRQALVLEVVPPEERISASVATSSSRYLVRPLSPGIAAATSHFAFAAPLILAGCLKAIYDLAFLLWAQRGGYLRVGVHRSRQ